MLDPDPLWVLDRCQVKLTTLLIPGHNDATSELRAMCGWVAEELGLDVPMHFSAFHPDHRMRLHSGDPVPDAEPRPDHRDEAASLVCRRPSTTPRAAHVARPVLRR